MLPTVYTFYIFRKYFSTFFKIDFREDGCGRIQIATEQHIYTLVTPFSTELHKIMNRLIAA